MMRAAVTGAACASWVTTAAVSNCARRAIRRHVCMRVMWSGVLRTERSELASVAPGPGHLQAGVRRSQSAAERGIMRARICGRGRAKLGFRGLRPSRCPRSRRARAQRRGHARGTARRGARAHRGRQPEAQRGDSPDGSAGARRDRGGPAGRSVPRRAVPAQGPHDGLRRGADAQRLAAVSRLRAAGGRGTDAALQGGGPRDLRQDQYARVRRLERDRARVVRSHAQSVASRSHVERVQRWLGGRGRRADRAGRQRQRRWRLDPHPSLQLWSRRAEAEPRSQSDRPAAAGRLVRLHRRTRRDADGARLRRVARRDLRRLSAAAHETAAARAAVPRRGAGTRGAAAHRLQLRSGSRQDPARGESRGARNRRHATVGAGTRARRRRVCRCRARSSCRAMPR